MKYNDLTKCLYGSFGTLVNLRIKSPGRKSQEKVVTITRNIKLSDDAPATGRIIDFKGTNDKITRIGWIRLDSFFTDCDISDILNNFKKNGVEGYIIDLRNNPGGHVNKAKNIIGEFVGPGKPLYQASSRDGLEIVKSDRKSDLNKPTLRNLNKIESWDEKPLVILVNEESASCAELVPTVLKNHKRAYIVGSQTFGKHVAHDYVPIILDFCKESAEPVGFIKYTSRQLYDFDGKTYQGKGIVPDIQIPSSIQKQKRFGNQILNDERELLPWIFNHLMGMNFT